jgi:hypothetical protein
MDPYQRGLSGPEMFTFYWREVYVMIPRASDGDMGVVRADIERFAAGVPGQFGILSWVTPGAKLPSTATRRGIHQHMTELSPRLAFSVVLIEGSGPFVSGFLTVASSLMRWRFFDRYPQALCQSIGDASAWLANQMGRPSVEISGVLRAMSRELAPPARARGMDGPAMRPPPP